MTCIVGIEFNDKVLMGGDIQGTGYNNKVVHTQPKVFNKKGVLFGFTTSYRFGQLLEHGLADPVVPEDDNEIYRWLITVLIPDIKKALKTGDYEKGGTCLIGVKGQLWELQDDFSVLRSVKGYTACGSGYEYAMGSMFTTAGQRPSLSTQQEYTNAVKAAILTAGTFSPSVGTDSVVISN
jgi:ATP-dependent protease HslVU (ClpYQ) peptidase subunit